MRTLTAMRSTTTDAIVWRYAEHIHDTYAMYSATKFNDTGWDDASGSMKISYNGTCTKS